LRGDEEDDLQGVVRGQQHSHAAGVADDSCADIEQSGSDSLGASTGQLCALQGVSAQMHHEGVSLRGEQQGNRVKSVVLIRVVLNTQATT